MKKRPKTISTAKLILQENANDILNSTIIDTMTRNEFHESSSCSSLLFTKII